MEVSAFGNSITIDKPDFYFSPTETYGILGWVETAIMILAGASGVISLLDTNPNTVGIAQRLVKSRLGEVILISMLLLFYLTVPVFRYLEGEIFALIFSIFFLVCQVFLFFGVIFGTNPGQWIFVYALLMILACLVKLMFLYLRKEFEVRILKRPALYAITLVCLAAQVVLLILQITDWLTSYDGATSQ